MNAVTGIFDRVEDAKQAVETLRELGVREDRINVIMPGTTQLKFEESVETEDAERSGVGTALGGVLGGTAGLLAASFLVPGVGPFAAIGVGAAQLILAIGAAAGGAAVGHALENAAATGIPHDDLFIYEDAVRQGRALVIATPSDAAEADRLREAFNLSGAESVDEARKSFWTGLRGAEKVHYETAHRGSFEAVEKAYRRGFEAAHAFGFRGRSYDEVLPKLVERYGEEARGDAFLKGFTRGREYLAGALAGQIEEKDRA